MGNLKRATAVVSLATLLAVAAMVGAERAQAAATCAGKKATIVGTNGANVLVGTNQADVIVAGGGNDTIKGKGGADLICAGGGNDYVDGGPAHDVVRGDAGHDTCVTSPGGGADKFVACEDRTAFDLQIEDGLDWGFVTDEAEHDPLAGEKVTTTLRLGAGGLGHAGYGRKFVAPQGLLPGTTTPLSFGSETDDGAVFVALPFEMPFFGIPYSQVSVSTNGRVAFGVPAWDYLDDDQFQSYRGFNNVVGNFEGGIMPYWGDLDISDPGGGGGSVSFVEVDSHTVAIQWDAGECCSFEPPRVSFSSFSPTTGASATTTSARPRPTTVRMPRSSASRPERARAM